ncbi:MAG: methyltransferase domain-containing protein [Hyphomicrobiaceae bacterium]|nr:methyltransferase domain-containing protein [Hyphomicrobiaceae bacterium]
MTTPVTRPETGQVTRPVTRAYSPAAETARAYYNSADADAFYAAIWGGEDIHIGIYDTPQDDIAAASRRTVAALASLAPALTASRHVLDIGAGFGGAARYLASRFGCRVTALNLSERENERNRALTDAQGLAGLVSVIDGAFEDIPLATASVDLVWSQDALLHSADRNGVFAEVARVLRPGGAFVLTDIMDSGRCDAASLAPVLARIYLADLGSLAAYQAMGEASGLVLTEWRDMREQLPRHYAKVAAELARRRGELAGQISDAYMDRMLAGLAAWIEAGERGCLDWGLMRFDRSA